MGNNLKSPLEIEPHRLRNPLPEISLRTRIFYSAGLGEPPIFTTFSSSCGYLPVYADGVDGGDEGESARVSTAPETTSLSSLHKRETYFWGQEVDRVLLLLDTKPRSVLCLLLDLRRHRFFGGWCSVLFIWDTRTRFFLWFFKSFLFLSVFFSFSFFRMCPNHDFFRTWLNYSYVYFFLFFFRIRIIYLFLIIPT